MLNVVDPVSDCLIFCYIILSFQKEMSRFQFQPSDDPANTLFPLLPKALDQLFTAKPENTLVVLQSCLTYNRDFFNMCEVLLVSRTEQMNAKRFSVENEIRLQYLLLAMLYTKAAQNQAAFGVQKFKPWTQFCVHYISRTLR
eukprot:TRINITY_DN20359_c0_g1_i1.p1 TRINITY_DN20359_c0_g1~~TRINITY_DN20359_c0_g1_i1.p1  ORF type:complete len:142 (-),score=12.69 TRINITY_DN20359_c0_g1_i1:208-633(-)